MLLSALVSTNHGETLKNADRFLETKDYRTAAALYTAAVEYLQVPTSAERVANILCKRADCLLRLVILNDSSVALRDWLSAISSFKDR